MVAALKKVKEINLFFQFKMLEVERFSLEEMLISAFKNPRQNGNIKFGKKRYGFGVLEGLWSSWKIVGKKDKTHLRIVSTLFSKQFTQLISMYPYLHTLGHIVNTL